MLNVCFLHPLICTTVIKLCQFLLVSQGVLVCLTSLPVSDFPHFLSQRFLLWFVCHHSPARRMSSTFLHCRSREHFPKSSRSLRSVLLQDSHLQTGGLLAAAICKYTLHHGCLAELWRPCERTGMTCAPAATHTCFQSVDTFSSLNTMTATVGWWYDINLQWWVHHFLCSALAYRSVVVAGTGETAELCPEHIAALCLPWQTGGTGPLCRTGRQDSSESTW